jgi:hypothetical protein
MLRVYVVPYRSISIDTRDAAETSAWTVFGIARVTGLTKKVGSPANGKKPQ